LSLSRVSAIIVSFCLKQQQKQHRLIVLPASLPHPSVDLEFIDSNHAYVKYSMYWYWCCKDVSYKQESEQSTRTTYVTQLIENLSEYVLKTRVGYTLLSFLDLRLLFFCGGQLLERIA